MRHERTGLHCCKIQSQQINETIFQSQFIETSAVSCRSGWEGACTYDVGWVIDKQLHGPDIMSDINGQVGGTRKWMK